LKYPEILDYNNLLILGTKHFNAGAENLSLLQIEIHTLNYRVPFLP